MVHVQLRIWTTQCKVSISYIKLNTCNWRTSMILLVSKVLNWWSSCKFGHERLNPRVYIIIWISCIWLFSFLYLFTQNLTQIDDGSRMIHNWAQRIPWTLLLTLYWMWIMISRVMIHDTKDLNKNIKVR